MNISTPLYEALQQYIKQPKNALHMPGHKQGNAIPAMYKKDIFKMDLTELPGLDNLHVPEGPILKAQQMAAQAFGARDSFFLVNGASCGIQAMIAAVCMPGDEIIVDRNCHAAVFSALILTGAVPRYIYPIYNEALGLIGGICPNDIKKALAQYPKAKAVLITCPTYHGICSDLKKIAQIVHEYDKVLLVDEAHGAHFCFNEKLPISAMAAGADMCVQGAHKTLPALTQSALLHINHTSRIDIDRVKSALKLFQTTSPSFVLMAYLDVARHVMQENGEQRLEKIISVANHIREYLNQHEDIYCINRRIIGKQGIYDVDATRFTINFNNASLTGYEVANILNQKYNIQVEMADIYNIVCILSVGDFKKDLQDVCGAVMQIKDSIKTKHKKIKGIPPKDVHAVPTREAYFSDTQQIPLKHAVGRISASVVSCYPPCIPILCPGEMITSEMITYIYDMDVYGAKITGLRENFSICVIKQ